MSARALRWGTVVALVLGAATAAVGIARPPLFTSHNASGVERTIATAPVTLDSPFFDTLGTNGRTCATCHVPTEGLSITPAGVRRRFAASEGLDPLFRPNDGSVSPLADISTLEARREAYALLLSKALIRVGRGRPAGAEFEVTDIDDPYGFATASELSLFRRPLPATNLRFLATVMWDGRETFRGQTIRFDLLDQANAATVGHAEGLPLPTEVRERIVDFESSLLTAQLIDRHAGALDAAGVTGGPDALRDQPFWRGINSTEDPTGTTPTSEVFTLFTAWASAVGRHSPARQAIARGQALFNTRTFGQHQGTCSSCHNTPNVGTSSIARFFDLGVADASRRTPDVPLYTLTCTSGPYAGRIIRTTDPGLALTTGRCSDIGRFKVPSLRALAGRAPYFHDGSAPTLEAVVDFYDERFGIGLADPEKADLVAFLRAL